MADWTKQRDDLISEFESRKTTSIIMGIFLVLMFGVLGFIVKGQSLMGYFTGFFQTLGYGLMVFGVVMAIICCNNDISQVDNEVKTLKNITTKEGFDSYIRKAKYKKIAAKVILKILGNMG